MYLKNLSRHILNKEKLMKNLIFFLFCLLSIINIKIKGSNSYYKDYMALENTSPIKGIFVWLIIMSHYKNYYKSKSLYICNQIISCLGQKMVSLFLFYSGYGIFESIKRKGINYVNSLPKKSLILYIKFQLILLIFLLNNKLLGIKFNYKIYILSIIFKGSLGNSNWFSFTIISLYLYSFISFRFIKNEKYNFIGIIFITILSYFHTYFTFNYFYPKKIYSVDNILCFLIGIYYSILKKYLDQIFMKNDILYFGNITILIVIYYYFYTFKNSNIFLISITNSLFSLIIILISMKIRFSNEFLIMLNSHSYSIYLLQRVIMINVIYRKYFEKSEFIRFIFIFISILLISNIFDKSFSFIDNILKRDKKTNQIKTFNL